MTREWLEQRQVLVYLACIAAGLFVGTSFPSLAERFEAILWPTLGLLLYATFSQVPLVRLRDVALDRRFLVAAIVGNFLVLPLVAWGLSMLAPSDPAVHLGVLLVLLVPCTDWFITFTHVGGGDTRRAIAFTPVSLLLQLALLPVYLSLFLGTDVAVGLVHRELLTAFFALIALPLLLAFVPQTWAERGPRRQRVVTALAWLPVPLLAVVVFSIAAAQVGVVVASAGLLGHLLAIFVAFLLLAALLARVLALVFALPPAQGRVLAFSLGSRNSFVVLPLALALPAPFELAIVVIVFQSMVELCGMVAFVWLVPRRLFPTAHAG